MREELAWAAGLFEGEGSFHLRHKMIGRYGVGSYRQPTASLSMTDQDCVEKFARAVTIGRVSGAYPLASGKTAHVWSAGSFEHVQALVALLWPWLGQRRRVKASAMLREIRDLHRDPEVIERLRQARVRAGRAGGAARVAAGLNDCQRVKTHCPRGHCLAAPNLLGHALRQGVRACKECHRQVQARRREIA